MPNKIRMPVLFISHGGGPWPFIDGMRNAYAATLQQLALLPTRLPQLPAAILVATAHWEAPQFTVSSSANPSMLYDYSGFPENTYRLRYPAPGSPPLAARISELFAAAGIAHTNDSQRGFDHGTFVPLMVMFPDAAIPVVMLSLKSGYDPLQHIAAGTALQPLRDEGVLIIGSGLTYHNMRGFGHDAATAVAEEFEEFINRTVAETETKRNSALIEWEATPGARLAHPQEDHLLPLMVAVGAAGADLGKRVFVDTVMKIAMGSYAFGTLD